MSQSRFGLVVATLGISTACAFAQTAATPKACLERLEARIDALLKPETPPLFAWHLRSLRALANSEYAKLPLQVPQSLTRPVALRETEFVEYVTQIANGLDGDASDPRSYLERGTRALVLARPSALDGSLQYMTLNLPRGWDPARTYPLFVGLHGSGPDNPLAYPSFALAPQAPSSVPPVEKPINQMIQLAPWGRGNRAWRFDAEQDLFEAIDVVKSIAKLDADRWYLTGHSSGADGAWAILQHTPDLWAAAGIQSGSMIWGKPEWGLIPNMIHVPTHFLIGELDDLPGRIPDNKQAFEILSKAGAKTKLVILPKVGHYPLSPEGLDEQMDWLFANVRKRPDHFTFTIDQAIHPGVWGIRSTMTPRETRFVKEPWPSFECSIKGSDVRIKTKNLKELSVDLGPSGLNLKGDLRLWINGKLVYQGPATTKPIVHSAS